MKTAGIMIEQYKLPIFCEHLDSAGYEYTQEAGPFVDFVTLKVETDDMGKLGRLIVKMDTAAKRSRFH